MKKPRKNQKHKRLEARAARKAENEAKRAPKPAKPLHSKSRGTSNSRTARKATMWPDGTVEAGS